MTTLPGNEIGAMIIPTQSMTSQTASFVAAQDLQFLTNAVTPFFGHPMMSVSAVGQQPQPTQVTRAYQQHFARLRGAVAPFVNNGSPSVRLAAYAIYQMAKTLSQKNTLNSQSLNAVVAQIQKLLTLASGQQSADLQD